MTPTDWVNTALATKIRLGVLYPDDTQGIPVPDFVTIYGASIEAELAKPAPDMYTALSGPQTFVWDGETLTMTAAEMGHQGFLDQWHIEGLI